jgi:hypothetical protein
MRRDMVGSRWVNARQKTPYISGWSFGGEWPIFERLVAVQNLLHIVDVSAIRRSAGENLLALCQ